MIEARIHKTDGRVFTCKRQDNGQTVTAKASGNLLKKTTLVVGDYIELTQEGAEFKIVALKPRLNTIYRLSVRERRKKISAANVDCLAIVCSLSKPAYKRGLLDRYLARARQWEVPPIVIFNKMDEKDPSIDLNFEQARLAYCSIPCFSTGALSNSLSTLKIQLAGKTVLFVGQSGVGKSTLITALSEGKIVLKSAQIGRAGKGIHTTTWSEIIESDRLTLIDSPGIRSFSIDDIQQEHLIDLFPPLSEIAKQCPFSNCTHDPNAPGCAFYKDSDPIVLSYLESYRRLLSEAQKIPSWKK